MKIVLLEPLGVPKERIESLAAPFVKAGHEFTPYFALASDESEQLDRVKDADVIIMANHPLSSDVIEKCEQILKDLNPQFAKDKLQEEKINSLEERMGGVEDTLGDIKDMLSKALNK